MKGSGLYLTFVLITASITLTLGSPLIPDVIKSKGDPGTNKATPPPPSGAKDVTTTSRPTNPGGAAGTAVEVTPPSPSKVTESRGGLLKMLSHGSIIDNFEVKVTTTTPATRPSSSGEDLSAEREEGSRGQGDLKDENNGGLEEGFRFDPHHSTHSHPEDEVDQQEGGGRSSSSGQGQGQEKKGGLCGEVICTSPPSDALCKKRPGHPDASLMRFLMGPKGDCCPVWSCTRGDGQDFIHHGMISKAGPEEDPTNPGPNFSSTFIESRGSGSGLGSESGLERSSSWPVFPSFQGGFNEVQNPPPRPEERDRVPTGVIGGGPGGFMTPFQFPGSNSNPFQIPMGLQQQQQQSRVNAFSSSSSNTNSGFKGDFARVMFPVIPLNYPNQNGAGGPIQGFPGTRASGGESGQSTGQQQGQNQRANAAIIPAFWATFRERRGSPGIGGDGQPFGPFPQQGQGPQQPFPAFPQNFGPGGPQFGPQVPFPY